jgi:hypothetical protein
MRMSEGTVPVASQSSSMVATSTPLVSDTRDIGRARHQFQRLPIAPSKNNRRTAQPFAVLNTQYRVPERFHRIAANPT